MTKSELLEHFGIKIRNLKKIGNNTVINDEYIYKEMNRKSDIFDYLITRGFTFFPKVYSNIDDEIELMDYIIDKDIPKQQRLEDISYLASILHLDTTYDKKIDLDSIKEIYESTTLELEKLYNYYYDKQNQIEEEIYMSPANYLLIRNVSLIYRSINLSKEFLDRWYQSVKDKDSIRYALIHGNLKDSNLLEEDNFYLISWDKARIDFPIYDLIILYKNNYLDIGLSSILNIYEKNYPLKKEEKLLLFSKLLVPRELNYCVSEYLKVKDVTDLISYLDTTYDYLKNYSNEANNNATKQDKN